MTKLNFLDKIVSFLFSKNLGRKFHRNKSFTFKNPIYVAESLLLIKMLIPTF